MRAVALSFGLSLGLASAGCHLVGGAGDYTVREDASDAESSGGGSSSSTTGGFTSSTGGGACDEPADCPASDCAEPTCEAGVCGTSFTAAGAACDDDGGIVCDGDGACVACLEGPCGAYQCAANGLACLDDCNANGTADCASGHYCDVGSCVPFKADGLACDNGAECSSGSCVDAVCCDSACSGACQSCALPGNEGVCLSHAPGSDPDGECGTGVCDGESACAFGSYAWHLAFGNGEYDVFVEDMAVDAAGSALLVGRFTETLAIGTGELTSQGTKQSGFIAKLDAQGNHLWSKRFNNGAEDQFAQGVAVDLAGNVVVAGRFRGGVDFGGTVLNSTAAKHDAFIAKYDGQGNLQWVERFGNGNEAQYAEEVAIDASGAVTVVGRFRLPVDFGGGLLATNGAKHDMFVARYDAQGNHLWSKGIGNGLQDQYAEGVAVEAGGDVVVVGRFFGALDFGSGLVMSAGGKYDAFATKYSANGAHQWTKVLGDGLSDQFARSVAIDGAGDVVVAGRYRGAIDFGGGALPSAGAKHDAFLAKYAADGLHLWSQRFGNGVDDQYGEAVAVDAAGAVVMVGSFRGAVDFGGGAVSSVGGKDDAFVARYHPSGALLWSRGYGDGITDQQGTSAGAAPGGDAFAAGTFKGTIDFGTPSTSAGNKANGFLVKLDP